MIGGFIYNPIRQYLFNIALDHCCKHIRVQESMLTDYSNSIRLHRALTC